MIVDLAALRLYLKVDDTVTIDDDLIVEMESAAQAYLEEETGRYYGPIAALVDTLNSYGWGPVWLRAEPIAGPSAAPLALVERRSTITGEWAEVDSSLYEIEGVRLYPRAFWEPAKRSVRVTYTGGFGDGEQPENVRQAVRELVARMYTTRLPYVQASALTPLPASVHDVIRAYKAVHF